jgi:hypothetical protein
MVMTNNDIIENLLDADDLGLNIQNLKELKQLYSSAPAPVEDTKKAQPHDAQPKQVQQGGGAFITETYFGVDNYEAKSSAN